MARNYPKAQQTYSLAEISVQDLDDSPALGFNHLSIDGCIQDSHVTLEELLSVPGMAESRWTYIRTTHEWIPVFRWAASNPKPIEELVDLETYKDCFPSHENAPSWWATPKGFPRDQSQ